MTEIYKFTTIKNINLIWVVIQEEQILVGKSPEFTEKVINFIHSTLYDFFEQEKYNVQSLPQLNKKYIIYILHYINSLIN